MTVWSWLSFAAQQLNIPWIKLSDKQQAVAKSNYLCVFFCLLFFYFDVCMRHNYLRGFDWKFLKYLSEIWSIDKWSNYLESFYLLKWKNT